jgi:kynurenine formamidase
VKEESLSSRKWTFGEHSGTHNGRAAGCGSSSGDVTGIGVDTLSLDPGNSATFPVHVNFLETDRYGLENVANFDKIPPRGAVAYVGLIPWEQGSRGPCRVIASW